MGAAVAVTLGAGGISLGQAAIGSGEKPVFVAIEPCRLVDTRPGDVNIGTRATPLGAGNTLTLQVTGSQGECAGVPTDAVAAAMNVTAIQGSTRSFLSVYPADADRPNASNLNWNGGDPPTPNKVDVDLSASGAVKFTNDAGTVHIAADLVGYYIDHTHDDRYYTKNQIYTKDQIDALLLATTASVTAATQGPTVSIDAGETTTVVSATLVPPSNGDVFAVGIAPRVDDGAADYECSLSTNAAMHLQSTQAGGDVAGQIVPVRGFTVTSGTAVTVNLVCAVDVASLGSVDISQASIRLIFFPG